MFNDDCDVFDISPDNADHDRTDNTVWDLVAPSIAQDNALTNKSGFSMLQDNAEGKQSDARCSGTKQLPSSKQARHVAVTGSFCKQHIVLNHVFF